MNSLVITFLPFWLFFCDAFLMVTWIIILMVMSFNISLIMIWDGLQINLLAKNQKQYLAWLFLSSQMGIDTTVQMDVKTMTKLKIKIVFCMLLWDQSWLWNYSHKT